MFTIVIAPVPAGDHDVSMSHLGLLSGASLLILSLAACTTQSYGRATPVSEREKALLTCEQIVIEIGKAEFFIADIQQQRGETTSAHVIGALLDFGIGNSIEGNAAEASGHDRLRDLRTLKAEKGCNG